MTNLSTSSIEYYFSDGSAAAEGAQNGGAQQWRSLCKVFIVFYYTEPRLSAVAGDEFAV